MEPLWIVAIAAGALLLGAAGGYLVGARRGRRRGGPRPRKPGVATMAVIDGLVADSIGRLRSFVGSALRGDDDALTLAPDGTITLLFSDIERSTSLNHRVGDERFAEILRSHDEVVRRIVRGHGGRVVKTQGDGFMAAFHDPVQGVRCAVALRDELARSREVGVPLRLRLGVHVGSAVTTDDDVFGATVALTARIAASAPGGQVLVSDAVRDRAADAEDLRFVAERRRHRLKGIPGRHRLHAADRVVAA